MTAPTDPDRPDEPTVEVSWASSAPPSAAPKPSPRRRALVGLAIVSALVFIIVAVLAVRTLLLDRAPPQSTPTSPAPSPTDQSAPTPAPSPPASRPPTPGRSTSAEPTFRAARVIHPLRR